MSQKKITCISYHGTGSGAVDDFLREFDNCVAAESEVECRFLQDPDGVADLEYNLLENPHRLNSGYAIKRFERYVHERIWTYRKIFGKNWEKLSTEYAQSLITTKYKGYWHCDLLLLNPVVKLGYYFRRAVNKLLPRKLKRPNYYDYFPKKDYYHSFLSEEAFLEKTRDYCEKLCGLLNPEKKEYVILDQMIPTSNIDRYLRYVDDMKVIVVDRDPRDTFINHKKGNDHVLPKDAETFARVYREQREISKKSESPNVMYVQFEDLIYSYEETTAKIMEFLDLKEENHIHKLEYFDPNVSIKNTKMWEKMPQYADECEKIAQILPEYLHKY